MPKNKLTVVIIAYAMFIVLGIPSGLLNVAWPSIRQSYAVTDEVLGILLLAGTIGYLIASFVSGRIMARLTIPYALALSILVAAGGLVGGYVLATDWWLLIVIVFIGGMGSGVIDSGMNLHFARNFSPALMNWLHASFGLGAAIGPILMTALITQGVSWRWGYAIVAIAYMILGALVLLTRHLWDSEQPIITGTTVQREFTLWQSLRNPVVLLGVLLFFIYAGIEVAVPQWSYVLFTDQRGIEVATAGTWVSLYWASFTIGRVFFGFVASRIALVPVMRACMIAVIIGSVMLWQNTSDILNLFGIIIIGFAMAPVFPLLISDTPARLGTAHAGNAIGFQVGAASLGIGAIPGVAGLLAVSFSLEIIGPYLVVTSIIMLLVYHLVSTHKIPQPDAETAKLGYY